MTTGRIATISGTMLTPGVSRNRRLYSKELIAKAAARMSERIADPDGLPIVMRTHHEAGDDSQKIVGRVTSVKVGEDGSAKYSADLYDTAPGRDMAALITGKTPALRSVSIHGYWLGPVKRVQHEGESVTTGDDLEIDAVDFTATPGVLGATVTAAAYTAPGSAEESTGGRTPISESVEATVEAVTEEVSAEAYSAKHKQAMTDKGQAMKNASGDPSYPIKSKSDLRKAIRAVGRGGADHDAIRRHIVKRAAALGLTSMIPDNWNKDGSMKETATRLGEIREYYPDGPGGQAGFCVDAYNGPISITLRVCGIDPAELRAITQAAMAAACDALQAMDPDMDADIDVPGAPDADTDGDMGGGESAPAMEHVEVSGQVDGHAIVEAIRQEMDRLQPPSDALTETTAPKPVAATPPQEEAAMGEPTPNQETAAPTRSLTDADITALGALFGAALKENLAPVLAAVTENAAKVGKKDKKAQATETAAPAAGSEPETKGVKKPLKETLAETVAEMQAEFNAKLEEALARQRDELRESILKEKGLPPRQGYRVHENEQREPTDEDLFDRRAELLLGSILPQPAQ